MLRSISYRSEHSQVQVNYVKNNVLNATHTQYCFNKDDVDTNLYDVDLYDVDLYDDDDDVDIVCDCNMDILAMVVLTMLTGSHIKQ